MKYAPFAGLWLLLLAVSLATRSLLPLDETRYLAVAWEMWQRDDFLVPFLNGVPYHHKPPLLFWLIHLGWAVFGVNEWWPRLVPPLFGLLSLVLTERLARRLWPDNKDSARLAPLIVLGSLLWTLFATLVMFDLMLACCVLLGVSALVELHRQGGGGRGWLVFGLALGLGGLSKGPVILLHLLPVALLAPWWTQADTAPRWGRWYLGLGAALLLGFSLALLWAIPAGLRGGTAFREAIFFGQTAGRMVQSFAHSHPFWWYLPLLPLLLFPWLLWPRLWRALAAGRGWQDLGLRLCLAWILPVFLAFSLISGKQVHYLLPLFPGFALLAAFALSQARDLPTGRWELLLPGLSMISVGGVLLALALSPALALQLAPWAETLPLWPGVAVLALGVWLAVQAPRPLWPQTALLTASSVALITGLHLGLIQSAAPGLDLHGIARTLDVWQKTGVPLAHFGKYHGQYQFLGRLQQPLNILPQQSSAVQDWFVAHPQGRLLSYTIDPTLREGAAYSQPYRGGYVLIWEYQGFLNAPYWKQWQAEKDETDDKES